MYILWTNICRSFLSISSAQYPKCPAHSYSIHIASTVYHYRNRQITSDDGSYHESTHKTPSCLAVYRTSDRSKRSSKQSMRQSPKLGSFGQPPIYQSHFFGTKGKLWNKRQLETTLKRGTFFYVCSLRCMADRRERPSSFSLLPPPIQPDSSEKSL